MQQIVREAEREIPSLLFCSIAIGTGNYCVQSALIKFIQFIMVATATGHVRSA
jgi:hypothetical protein